MKIAKKVVTDNAVIFTFANGRVLKCDYADVDAERALKLALHGISQKVGDSYASAESVEAAIAAATEVWTNLCNGIWATRATGGKLAEALSRHTGQPIDACIAKLATMDDKAKAGLRKHPDIKRAMAEIELERAEAAAGVPVDENAPDLDELFNDYEQEAESELRDHLEENPQEEDSRLDD